MPTQMASPTSDGEEDEEVHGGEGCKKNHGSCAVFLKLMLFYLDLSWKALVPGAHSQQ